jgi:hypothetical protein
MQTLVNIPKKWRVLFFKFFFETSRIYISMQSWHETELKRLQAPRHDQPAHSKVAEAEEHVRVHHRRLLLLPVLPGKETAAAAHFSSSRRRSWEKIRRRWRWLRSWLRRLQHAGAHGELRPRRGQRGADLLLQAVDDPRAAVDGVLHPPPPPWCPPPGLAPAPAGSAHVHMHFI